MLIGRQFKPIPAAAFSLFFGLVCIASVASVYTGASHALKRHARPQEENLPAEAVDDNDQLRDRSDHEDEGRLFLQTLEKQASEVCNREVVAEWRYASDITDQNERLKLEENIASAKFRKEAWKNVTSFNWKLFSDGNLRRQFKLMSVLGPSALPEEKYTEYVKTVDGMEKIYSTAKICSYKDKADCGLGLEPEITEIMRKSRNFDELKWVWHQWHQQSGGKMREDYGRFVRLSNEAARMNNFSDTAAYWLNDYETETFRDEIEQLWQTLEPFYMQLHAYVRAKLRAHYGEDKVPKNKPIPAHLLGNMWAQTWSNILDITIPYPGKVSVDVTPEMNRQGYTAEKMFRKSDEFFTELGLIAMPPEFWSESIIEKPSDREMVCHASAWDFCNGKDFRIKQCTRINMEDLITVHHEMGHIEYYLQYKDQPKIFRQGANPGFHEAVGDTLALSVQTPKHLKQIGLLDPATSEDEEATINFLFSTALDKLAFFPFAYIMDKWRWDVFDGTVASSDYNCHWWKLRESYQGIRSPIPRSENDFDPGAKYHIAANVEYIRYFVSFVIQFQFHKALCLTAGQYDPNDPSKRLHNCDINGNKEAGAKLAAMLSLGSSKPWPEAMRAITGQDEMDASAFREYFKPLEDWLISENKKMGETIGWDLDGLPCGRHPPSTPRPPEKAKSLAASQLNNDFSLLFLLAILHSVRNLCGLLNCF